MTYVHVDIHRAVHTCPADPQPHPIDIRRTVVAVVPGGPCRHPVTIRSGDTTTTVACGRHEPADRQCPACRITVIERHITTTDLGHQPRHPRTCGVAA